MASSHARKPRPAFIDLTGDEEDEVVLNHLHLAPATTIPILQDPQPSNHGLILPGTFDFHLRRSSIRSTRNSSSSVQATPLPWNSSIQLPRIFPQHGFQVSPRLPVNISQPNRRISTNKTLPSSAAAYRRSPANATKNGAKRRKTDVASSVQHSIPSTPMGRTALPMQQTAPQARMTNPRNPAPLGPTSKPRAIDSLHFQTRRPRTSPQNNNRRVSNQGRIQKQKPTQSSPGAAVKDDGGRMEYVLRNQVIKHVEAAIERYKAGFNEVERGEIWKKTVSQLTDADAFIANYSAAEWELSLQYEQQLAREAEHYVESFALEILNRNNPAVEQVEPPAPSFTAPPKSPMPMSSRGHSVITSSSSLETEEQLFESAAVVNHLPPKPSFNRKYSSSPATSFSHELDDGADMIDVVGHSDAKEPTTDPNPRITRQKRNQMQASKMNRSAPIQGSKLVNGMRIDMDDLRDVHALRSAGGSLPRPYLSSRDRHDIRCGMKLSLSNSRKDLAEKEQDTLHGSVFHVDFCAEELEFICKVIQAVRKATFPFSLDLRKRAMELMSGQESIVVDVKSTLNQVLKMPGTEVARKLLRQRDTPSLTAFLVDAVDGRIAHAPQVEHILSRSPLRKVSAPARPLISSLLRQREICGMAPSRVRQGHSPLNIETASYFEDTLARTSEWTDCCGDVTTVCWTSQDTFLCGAIAHSDHHNMQYNKPGNLVVGSATLDTLTAVSSHRVVRPLIEREHNAENALESMRRTQDPWLYTSVVSTSHSEISGHSFSASFDHTVKIWRPTYDGSMGLCGAWYHNGKVNFVVTSEHHGRVATASDVSSNAVRVYHFDGEDITNTPYDTYCGERAQEQERALEEGQGLEVKKNSTWAYFPATIQWGKSYGVMDLLLVGYSPRSVTGHEVDIPEEKRGTGELCIWNTELGTKIHISSSKTQNIFEVIWHPTQPIFLAATSPYGTYEPDVKTQIRLFAQNEIGSFMQIKALDCRASDINELTVMPNSTVQCYVTASCTDGNTYVWDTARGDDPIHILGHGESLDNPIHDLPREMADTGVQFASWGRTVGRFYTGSSDGKVKAWDVRKPKGSAFVRTILSLSGGVAAAAFSKDFSKLLVGDATGKVHLLEVEKDSNEVAAKPLVTAFQRPAGTSLLARRPKVIIPHRQPDPPPGYQQEQSEMTAQEMAQVFLDREHVILHPDPRIGAIQGPNYGEAMLYRYEAHEEADGTLPLLPEWEVKQRYRARNFDEKQRFLELPQVMSSDFSLHAHNVELDFEFSRLSMSTQLELTQADVDFDWDPIYDFELTPRWDIFEELATRRKREHNIK